jgi:protein-tyrosine phosphatase
VSARYATQFSLLSVAAVIAAFVGISHVAWRALLLWVAVAFSVVALAYATGRPRLLMKREDGSQPMVAWLILWPYLLFARFSLWLYRVTNRSAVPFAEAAPGIWFARRLTRAELLGSGVRWSSVLDLAAEFPRVAPKEMAYRSLPMLDGVAASERQLRDAVAWLDEQVTRGNVLVHCALGHGRTGSVVVAWLLLHGHVPDVRLAIAHLVARRSAFGMSKAQAASVKHLARENRNR